MLQPTADQLCVNVSRYCTYLLREKWVGDVAAYNRSDVRQRLKFLQHTHVERVGSVMLQCCQHCADETVSGR